MSSGVALFVFFFKQKTAYEMRISDWSSDVCSSDLDEPLKRIGYRDCLRKKGARLVRGRTAETLNLPREHDAPMRLISADILHQGRVGQIGRASCRERVCQYV